MKIIIIMLFLLLAQAKAAQNYLTVKNPLQEMVRNPFQEETDNRYNLNPKCAFNKSAGNLICSNSLNPKVNKPINIGDPISDPIVIP